ncbi:MAG: uroporphyrinogen decarboxylase [bacterium]
MNSRNAFQAAIDGDSRNSPTPVWFMRQAGRLFDEYRAIREDHDFKEVCRSAELNARVTCMPVERLNVDAAIIFADILLPLEGMGSGFELVPGKGPVIDNPVRTPDDVDQLKTGTPRQDLSYVYNAIEASIDKLPDDVPLIGFAGAPFTLASYLIEGGKSRSHHRTRTFMLDYPKAWDQLMSKIVDATVEYLRGQIDAGAEYVQLFDSWVGQLSPPVYQRHVSDHSREIIESIRSVPIIHFGTKTAGLLGSISNLSPDVVGLDWRIELEEAQQQLTDRPAVQGNLDPALFLTSFDTVKSHVDTILEQAETYSGHIFNLGHGILPDTEPEIVRRTVDYVHERTVNG